MDISGISGITGQSSDERMIDIHVNTGDEENDGGMMDVE